MSTTPEFTEAQLVSARAAAWSQAGEPLLTLEAARQWVNNYGLVLFAPHATTLGAPAPSLVEATLGEANTAPTAAQTEAALGLLGRMVAEGSAVPLNLLGGPGDVPDFVASAQVFSYCYTLRGDKAWKQPPAQTGAVKVSPLSLRVFEVMTERGSLSADALAAELGREVTVSAVTRALGELWAQMRVLPRRDAEGTAWELTTQRFTKVIKAGSNAGLPKALSALVSLYLHQAISASEGEVEAFLSPLTARSRIREVVHALTSARELETLALDGKTLLYVADTLPEFAPGETNAEDAVSPDASPEGGEPESANPISAAKERSGTEGRIGRFKGSGGGDLRGKPVRPATAPKARGAGFGRGNRDRPVAGRPGRTSAFSRPWEEERRERPAASPEGRPPRPFRARTDGEAKRPYRPRGEGEAPRPYRPRGEGEAPKPYGSPKGSPGRGPRSDQAAYRDRTPRAGTGTRPERRPLSREAGERPGGASGPRPFRPRGEGRGQGSGGDARPPRTPRPAWGAGSARGDRGERPARLRPERRDFPSAGPSFPDAGPKRSFPDRPRRERAAGEEPDRPYAPGRPGGGSKRFSGGSGPRPSGPRPSGARPSGARPSGTRAGGSRPAGFPSSGFPSSGFPPSEARSGGRNRGDRPGRAPSSKFGGTRPGSAGRSAGSGGEESGFGARRARPPAATGPRAPKKAGGAFSRGPRPARRPDEPAGEA